MSWHVVFLQNAADTLGCCGTMSHRSSRREPRECASVAHRRRVFPHLAVRAFVGWSQRMMLLRTQARGASRAAVLFFKMGMVQITLSKGGEEEPGGKDYWLRVASRGSHVSSLRSMALRMTRSFRMHAVRTTFGGLPLARSRAAKSRITGLCFLALRAAM